MEDNVVESVLVNNSEIDFERDKSGVISLPLRMSVVIFLYVAIVKPHDLGLFNCK